MARLAALALCAALACRLLAAPAGAAALVPRLLTLEQAQRMALSASREISRQNNQIVLRQMKYVEAVKGLRARVKNLRSFRWSPLLSFKFPQKLDFVQEYELTVKPLKLQAEIDILTHRLRDLEFEVADRVRRQYYEVYLLQETCAFTRARLDDAEAQLARNRAKLAVGGASRADVDAARGTVDALSGALARQLREFEAAKSALSGLIGTDVTVGYRFANGFKSAAIPREQLERITEYTLAWDQSCYEARSAVSSALLSLDTCEDLMRRQYGSKMDGIQTYVNMARQGMDIDYAAFQLEYGEMLKAVDRPWERSIRILFFRFTMEWLKGEISGTRYMEDELYALYTACMEYANAERERSALETELRGRVRESYEALTAAWDAFAALDALAEESRRSLERVLALNRLGKASYAEAAGQQSAFQSARQEALEALGDYNSLLSGFDRLTCGAAARFLTDAGLPLDTGAGGDAFAVLDPIGEPYYYIYTSTADLTFHIGISIPEGFSPAVDAFEVWYGDTQIGTRTAADQELRHLALDYGGGEPLTIRLYGGETYAAECRVDPAVPRDVLNLAGQAPPAAEERVIGTYSVKTALRGGISVSELRLSVNAAEGAALYSLSYGEKGIYATGKLPLDREFSYLTLLVESLDRVTLHLFDSAGSPLGNAAFRTDSQEIIFPAAGT